MSNSCIYHRLADTLTHIPSFFPHCFWLLAFTAIAFLSCAILFACLSESLICLNTVVVHCHSFLICITVINTMIYGPIGFAACAEQNGEGYCRANRPRDDSEVSARMSWQERQNAMTKKQSNRNHHIIVSQQETKNHTFEPYVSARKSQSKSTTPHQSVRPETEAET